MVGRSYETLPTGVEILVLAPFSKIFFSVFTGVVCYVLSGVIVDNEAPMVTSRISRFVGRSVIQRCS
jgi:hypothetical protein